VSKSRAVRAEDDGEGEGPGAVEMLAASSAGERSDGAVGEKRERADGSAVQTVNDVVVSRVGGPSPAA